MEVFGEHNKNDDSSFQDLDFKHNFEVERSAFTNV